MSQQTIAAWTHGMDEWTDGYIDGFEDAVRNLAKSGAIKEQRINKFFALAGLSPEAQKSIRQILESEKAS